MPIEDDYDFLFKTVIVGDSNVGKTQILSRFIDNQFSHDSKPTVGVEFGTKTIKVGEVCVKNQIWDTAGQEKFRALTSAYYRGAVGAIVVFDLSKNATFEHVQQWIKEVRQFSDQDATILLVGNKSDLEEHQVKRQDVENFAIDNKLLYISTSAATGENVQLAFEMLVKRNFLSILEIMGTVDPEPQIVLSDDGDDHIVNHQTTHKQNRNEKQIGKKQNDNHQPFGSNADEKAKNVKKEKPKMQTFSIEETKKDKNVKLKDKKSTDPKIKKKCC